MTMLITLTNSFHDTSARVKAGKLSKATVKRVQRELCGVVDCKCAECDLGTRGNQDDGVQFECRPDGTADVWMEGSEWRTA